MTAAVVFAPGGYRYAPAVFQYSGGAAAEPGFVVARVRLMPALALEEGFARARRYLESLGRPTESICAIELRSPAPFSEEGFRAFNERYAAALESLGLFRDGVNPVARTNVCPLREAPSVPTLHAFSHTERWSGSARPNGGFVVSGSGESPEGRASYRDHIVRPGDTSPEGLREKIRFVMSEMERRLDALGMGWRDAVSTQAYTVHDIGALIAPEILERGAASAGLTWELSRPPVAGLDFEMDVRGAVLETVLGPEPAPS